MFEPIFVPIAIFDAATPFNSFKLAIMCVKISGNDVPIDNTVNPTKSFDIFSLFADKNSGVTRNVVIDQSGNIVFLTRLFEEKEFESIWKNRESHLQNVSGFKKFKTVS